MVELQIQDSALAERAIDRSIHESSGTSYYITFNLPFTADKDDVTGEPLIQMLDDTEEKLKQWLEE